MSFLKRLSNAFKEQYKFEQRIYTNEESIPYFDIYEVIPPLDERIKNFMQYEIFLIFSGIGLIFLLISFIMFIFWINSTIWKIL